MSKVILGFGILVLVVIGGFFWLNNYIYQEKQGPTDYKNATYVIEGAPVTLVDGYAESESALDSTGSPQAGSASKTITRYFGNDAKGDLNGDDIPDLAFLLTQEGGGSGTFFYVVAALQTPAGTYNGTNAVLLGDRIAPQTTEIRDGEIIVNYADRVPGEPMSAAPSMGMSKYLKVEGEQLELSEEATYTSQELGLSFRYPRRYFLTERDTGSAQRKAHTITLIEDTPGNRALAAGEVIGEGPPAITIQLFQNDLDNYTTEEWIRGTNDSNFKLSSEGKLTTITLDDEEALSYRWSGLYEGTTIAQARPDWVYVFTVTYLEMGAQIVQDFVAMQDSVQIGK